MAAAAFSIAGVNGLLWAAVYGVPGAGCAGAVWNGSLHVYGFEPKEFHTATIVSTPFSIRCCSIFGRSPSAGVASRAGTCVLEGFHVKAEGYVGVVVGHRAAWSAAPLAVVNPEEGKTVCERAAVTHMSATPAYVQLIFILFPPEATSEANDL